MLARIALCAILLAGSSAAAEELFDFIPIADGVYAAKSRPVYKHNANAGLVILDDSVLVVDCQGKPSSARALIEQIRKVTDRPVRYVVSTHFHWDHAWGAKGYQDVRGREVEIIASEPTARHLELLGAARMRHDAAALRPEIDRLKIQAGETPDPEKKKRIEKVISDAEAFYGEISAVPLVVPTLVLKDRLTIRRPSRTVEILPLGKAHTDGDTVVYLPKEKVLFTGDLTHGLMPYMGDSYPYGWIQALDELLKLDIEYVFGGHGDVVKGKDVLRLWRDYLSDVMAETAAAYGRGMPLKEAQAFVAPRLEGKYASRFPPGVFKNQVANNVEKAYEVAHMR